MRKSWALLAVSVLAAGCSDWTPVKTARDIEGQRVRVQTGGKEIVIEEVALCDDDGFVVARDRSECHGDTEQTYDTRRDKVLVVDKDMKATVGIVVAGVLTAIFVPVAVVGSAILSAPH